MYVSFAAAALPRRHEEPFAGLPLAAATVSFYVRLQENCPTLNSLNLTRFACGESLHRWLTLGGSLPFPA